MAENTDFRGFVVDQVSRLEIFPKFGFVGSVARRNYRDWIEERTTDRAIVQALINAAVEQEEYPTLAELGRIWLDQNPPKATALTSCGYCGGSGWEVVDYGPLSGAKRCRCGGTVPCDPHASFATHMPPELAGAKAKTL
jgi:hypothetical protein